MSQNQTPKQRSEHVLIIENVKIDLFLSDLVTEEAPVFKMTPHTHTYTELFVCTDGEITVFVDTENIILKSGDALLIPPNITHYKIPSEVPAKWCAIAFSVEQSYVRTPSKLWQQLKPLCCGASYHIYRGVPEICKQIMQLCEGEEMVISCQPSIRLVLILTEFLKITKDTSKHNGNSINSGGIIERSVELEQIFEQRFMDNIDAAFVADKLHISKRQLSRVMQQQYGMSFYQTLLLKRLNGAEYLLKNSDMSIEQICSNVGFDSTSSFYRKFKERYHMTPQEYRRMNKK